MDNSFAAFVGLAGVLIGALLKVLYDLHKTRHDDARADVVWRREHALTAAADLLEAADAVHVLSRTINDSIQDYIATKEARHPEDVIRQKWERLELEKAQRRATLEKASSALSRLSLLVGQETYLAASKYVEAVTIRPQDPDTTGLKAHLNNLLRADLGLPARVIPPDQQISADVYRERIEAMRQPGATAAYKVTRDPPP